MSDLVYIKFDSLDDEANSIEELVLNTRVTALPGGIYVVDRQDLRRLDAQGLPYRVASEEELSTARGSVRHPVAPLL
jgi:hypothetical protein